MNNPLIAEALEYLDFDDWHDQDDIVAMFGDNNIESQITARLRDEDYFLRKQAFSDVLVYMQSTPSGENIPMLLDAVKALCTDPESTLRVDLAESIYSITSLCSSSKQLKGDWNCLENFTIICLLTLIHDQNKQVRLATHTSIINLVENKFINRELFMHELWPTMEETMITYNPDELRTECFTLLVQVNQLLENCLEYNILEYAREFISTNDNLRKTCAQYLCTIISIASLDCLNNWLDIFYKLSEDNSWYVKKFCIESAVALAKRVSKEERWGNITNAYYNFLTDSKKWVLTAAHQNLGAFIATFVDPEKTYCDLSSDGKVINRWNTRPIAQTENKSDDRNATQKTAIGVKVGRPNSLRESTHTSEEFSTFVYWKQPLENYSASTFNSVCTSIKEMDITPAAGRHENSEFSAPDLSQYKQTIVPPKLLQCYLNAVFEATDTDIIRPCAFSMPAIMFTLGPDSWPFLRYAYIRLIQSMSWKVRLSLASSIQHVFEIYKYNKGAVEDIISAYKEFDKDVDEVKVGLISNISDFFLSMPVYKYPEVFEDFSDLVHIESNKNWRYRVTCLEQMETVISNIDIPVQMDKTVFVAVLKKHWLSVIFEFASNEVFSVRLTAVNVMLKILEKMIVWKSHPDARPYESEFLAVINEILGKLLTFADSRIWYMRQLFLQSCTKLITMQVLPTKCITESLLPKYLSLCVVDTVPNNRMIGGQGLMAIFNHNYFAKVSESLRIQLISTCDTLFMDKDRDVRDSVQNFKSVLSSVSYSVKENCDI